MKKSELFESIIKDVIAASGGDFHEGFMEKLDFLFSKYRWALECEKMEETHD